MKLCFSGFTYVRNKRDVQQNPVTDPAFSWGRSSLSWCANLLFFKFLAENCMKMKEFGPQGEGGGWRTSLASYLGSAKETSIFDYIKTWSCFVHVCQQKDLTKSLTVPIHQILFFKFKLVYLELGVLLSFHFVYMRTYCDQYFHLLIHLLFIRQCVLSSLV